MSKPFIWGFRGRGVTGGDAHDHSGGDGAQVDHGALGGLSDDDHSQYQLVNDSAVLTVNGTYRGKTATVTVDDASAVFSSALYIAADFNYDRCDADDAGTMPCVVLALEAGAGSKLVLREGQICNTDWNWSTGVIYVDTTTGGLTQTPPSGSGDSVQIVGYAMSADTMYFDPDSTVVVIA
jgi:hypothetical protein